MQARFPIGDRGETVVEVQEGVVRIWDEYAEMLDGPPYFCVKLFLRSTDEGLPGASDYALFKYDWSDMRPDPEAGARVPRALLEKMLCCPDGSAPCETSREEAVYLLARELWNLNTRSSFEGGEEPVFDEASSVARESMRRQARALLDSPVFQRVFAAMAVKGNNSR